MRAFVLALLLLATPAASQELKLATWNLNWLTTKPAGHPALPRRLQARTEADFTRLRAYATSLNADIVALQEVDGRLAAARVFDATAYDFHFTSEPDVQGVGFAIRKTLRWQPNPDLVALGLRERLRRGADVSVQTSAGPLRLLSIHLKGGCIRDPLDGPRPDCVDLERQSEILAGWVRERAAANDAFVVLGDFNRRLGPDEGFLARLTAVAPLALANAGRSNPCWGYDSGFIDNIVLGGRARQWLADGSLRVLVYRENDRRLADRLSDHCPVSVRLAPRQ
jgi:endonuclease/exonuclease/phosphatase family metal-dependent hydrolase